MAHLSECQPSRKHFLIQTIFTYHTKASYSFILNHWVVNYDLQLAQCRNAGKDGVDTENKTSQREEVLTYKGPKFCRALIRDNHIVKLDSEKGQQSIQFIQKTMTLFLKWLSQKFQNSY